MDIARTRPWTARFSSKDWYSLSLMPLSHGGRRGLNSLSRGRLSCPGAAAVLVTSSPDSLVVTLEGSFGGGPSLGPGSGGGSRRGKARARALSGKLLVNSRKGGSTTVGLVAPSEVNPPPRST